MELSFLVYAGIYRIAVITAGIVSIVLGYRLFCKGVWPNGSNEEEIRAKVEKLGMGFTLKNAAPGTTFAAFGVCLIVTMIMVNSPTLNMEANRMAIQGSTAAQSLSSKVDRLHDQIKELTVRIESPQAYSGALSSMGIVSGGGVNPQEEGGNIASYRLRLRSSGELETIKSMTEKGMHFEDQNDIEKAKMAYLESIEIMAKPLNHLAWLLQKEGRVNEALPLSRHAVGLSPNNADFLDTLAEIRFLLGDFEDALHIMERAVSIMPGKYREKLSKFQRAVQNGTVKIP